MTAGKILIGQVLLVLAIVVLGTWTATEWTAWQLGFQRRLGSPWFRLQEVPVYYPWRLFEWWFVYEAYAPRVFNTGGLIAGGSGMLGALSAIPPGGPPPAPPRRPAGRDRRGFFWAGWGRAICATTGRST